MADCAGVGAANAVTAKIEANKANTFARKKGIGVVIKERNLFGVREPLVVL
jgi:hypothetical protein